MNRPEGGSSTGRTRDLGKVVGHLLGRPSAQATLTYHLDGGTMVLSLSDPVIQSIPHTRLSRLSCPAVHTYGV